MVNIIMVSEFGSLSVPSLAGCGSAAQLATSSLSDKKSSVDFTIDYCYYYLLIIN